MNLITRQQHIADTLQQWRHGTTTLETETTVLDIVATFDHDYRGVHLLMGVFTKEQEEKNYEWQGYQLWYLSPQDDYICRQEWKETEQGRPPFASAGSYVELWQVKLAEKGL
jgi:hypothetical protein